MEVDEGRRVMMVSGGFVMVRFQMLGMRNYRADICIAI